MIAIDDFGTGHSSLGYLRNFNVDYLKIDQSFVAMIGADALSRHILDSIIELSGKLDLGIVAEGVETQEQCDYLAAQGVDFCRVTCLAAQCRLTHSFNLCVALEYRSSIIVKYCYLYKRHDLLVTH